MKKKILAMATCMLLALSTTTTTYAAPSLKPVESFGFEKDGEMEISGGSVTKDSERGSVLTLNGGAKGASFAKADSDVYKNTDWTDGMTIAFWVKATDSTPGISPLYSFSIADHGSEGYIATTDSLEIAINSDGNSGMAEYPRVWADPSVVDGTAQPVLTAGKWQHVAVTLSASGMTVYLDGEKYSDPVLGPSSANFKLFTSQIQYCYGLQLGNWNCGWWEEIGSFAGSFDDVYVFNKSLSQNEVKDVMNTKYSDMTSSGSSQTIVIVVVAVVAVIVVVALGMVMMKKKKSSK
ncbi:MAG: LamG domain-containing protein [Lachnospiraceae bacterium]|nr:LamG domain-containing protein [Lachnospiraceae bacterium]